MLDKTVILIGPMCAGKSTVAKELSKAINIPQVPMDRVRWYYYVKDGYDFVKEQDIDSFSEKIKYWKPFEVKAVKRIVDEFKGSVIDFGAGHSFFTDDSQFKEVEDVLRPIKNIFLLLPSENKEESLKICNERLSKRLEREPNENEKEANRDFIFHSSNYNLAKHIIYTKDKTVDNTVEEIVNLIGEDV